MEARKFATLAGALTAAVPRHDAFHRAFTLDAGDGAGDQ
jgi:hypothetical protein